MKKFLRTLTIVLFLVLVFSACSMVANCIRTPPLGITVNFQEEKRNHKEEEEVSKRGVEMEMYPTGSSLPDCSYACGPCTPCKRVMISFKCSVAESCSVIYRCTCKGRYYHVPSRA